MMSMTDMNLTRTLLFFGIPGLLMYLGVQFIQPVLTEIGVPLIISWSLLIWGPIILLFLLIVFPYLSKSTDVKFSQRFRFKKMNQKQWMVVVVAFLGIQLFELLLSPTGALLSTYGGFALPPNIPELFDPNLQIENGLTTLYGIPLKGKWWLIGFWLGWLLINIGCEEILWRGYALPLQERYFGKYAWLVNGLSWNILIHFFMRWNVITLMPVSLIIPYLVQKHENTWIGVVLHGAGNTLVFVLIIPGILGST